jgi:hypothetical protein
MIDFEVERLISSLEDTPWNHVKPFGEENPFMERLGKEESIRRIRRMPNDFWRDLK